MIQLPLISGGTFGQNAAYLPFPALVRSLEAAPELKAPWLVPEYHTKDCDAKYIPAGFYTYISEEVLKDRLVITTKGYLTKITNDSASKGEYQFKAVYTFLEDEICMYFDTELPEPTFCVVYPRPIGANTDVSVNAEYTETEIGNNSRYFTPHGRCDVLKTWTGKGSSVKLHYKNIYM